MIDKFQKHFSELGFKQLTPIQEAVAKKLARGDSVLGIAPTGSGKTLAFTLPILPKVVIGQGVQALVLAPSQELAIQTTMVMREWARLLDLTVVSTTGGANLRRQVDALRSQHPEIVVGTPGRVLNLIDERNLKLDKLKTLVIDEADDLLQDDTLAVVEDIERVTPIDGQLAFFSATENPVFNDLDIMFGHQITKVDVREEDTTQGPVDHDFVQIGNQQKTKMLRNFSHIKDFRALVFFDKISSMQHVLSALDHDHVAVAKLGGDQRQVEREKALRLFRKRKLTYLVTTDVAARGLDIQKLPAVINFELPKNLTTYIHRAGRTGRMGEPGQVITFGNDHDFRDLKKMLADTSYNLQQVYFSHNRLVTEKPNTLETQVTSTHPSKTKMGSLIVKGSKSGDFGDPLMIKKHKKNRHSKSKGIRFKRRQQAKQRDK